MQIDFFVPGNPKTLKRHRMTKKGVVYDPSAGDKKDFLAKAMAHRPKNPISSAVALDIRAFFPRPKSHYGRRGGQPYLKDTAPHVYTSAPDGDNILKFVADALNGIFWEDDRLIYKAQVSKYYNGNSEGPCIYIAIEY